MSRTTRLFEVRAPSNREGERERADVKFESFERGGPAHIVDSFFFSYFRAAAIVVIMQNNRSE